jgi:hypothetical protein
MALVCLRREPVRGSRHARRLLGRSRSATHTLNAYVFYRFTPRFSASAKYRAGRNFPIPGYYAAEGGSFFVGMDRNALPLPVDGRLDLRANRTFAWPRRRPALFAEVINVLDQDNVRFSPADQQHDAASERGCSTRWCQLCLPPESSSSFSGLMRIAFGPFLSV